MTLKTHNRFTHLFIKNILLFLRKFSQYNKNFTKRQTKTNTAVNTSQIKLQKN